MVRLALALLRVSTDKFVDQWKETLATENFPWENAIDQGVNLLKKIIMNMAGLGMKVLPMY